MGYGYGHGGGMAMGAGDAIFHLITGALLLVILISIAVILLRFAMRGGSRRSMWMQHMMQQGSAIETLKERYAKGEIDRTEFEQKKKDLLA